MLSLCQPSCTPRYRLEQGNGEALGSRRCSPIPIPTLAQPWCLLRGAGKLLQPSWVMSCELHKRLGVAHNLPKLWDGAVGLWE